MTYDPILEPIQRALLTLDDDTLDGIAQLFALDTAPMAALDTESKVDYITTQVTVEDLLDVVEELEIPIELDEDAKAADGASASPPLAPASDSPAPDTSGSAGDGEASKLVEKEAEPADREPPPVPAWTPDAETREILLSFDEETLMGIAQLFELDVAPMWGLRPQEMLDFLVSRISREDMETVLAELLAGDDETGEDGGEAGVTAPDASATGAPADDVDAATPAPPSHPPAEEVPSEEPPSPVFEEVRETLALLSRENVMGLAEIFGLNVQALARKDRDELITILMSRVSAEELQEVFRDLEKSLSPGELEKLLREGKSLFSSGLVSETEESSVEDGTVKVGDREFPPPPSEDELLSRAREEAREGGEVPEGFEPDSTADVPPVQAGSPAGEEAREPSEEVSPQGEGTPSEGLGTAEPDREAVDADSSEVDLQELSAGARGAEESQDIPTPPEELVTSTEDSEASWRDIEMEEELQVLQQLRKVRVKTAKEPVRRVQKHRKHQVVLTPEEHADLQRRIKRWRIFDAGMVIYIILVTPFAFWPESTRPLMQEARQVVVALFREAPEPPPEAAAGPGPTEVVSSPPAQSPRPEAGVIPRQRFPVGTELVSGVVDVAAEATTLEGGIVLAAKRIGVDQGEVRKAVFQLAREAREPAEQALVSLVLGDLERAETLLTQALSEEGADEARLTYLLGQVAWKREEPQKAMGLFDEALEKGADEAEVHQARAAILRAQGDLDGALEALNRAIQADETYLLAHYEKVDILRTSGRLEEALEASTELMEQTTAEAAAHHDRGMILHEMGQLEEARDSFRRALEAAPVWRFASRSLAHNNLATVYEKLGSMSRAIEHFEKAVEEAKEDDEGPSVDLLTLNLGRAYLKGHFPEKAVPVLQEARDLFQMQPLGSGRKLLARANLYLGIALSQVHDFDDALEALRTSLALDPELHEARRRLQVVEAESARVDAVLTAGRQGTVSKKNPYRITRFANLEEIVIPRTNEELAEEAREKAEQPPAELEEE